MASGDSSTSICNIALIALGEDPITDVSDNNKRAILCKARYDDIRRFCLRTHVWNFAKKQAQIAADPVAPLFDWTSRYAIPADFIRFYREGGDQGDMSIWNVQQGFIYANTTGALDVLYIYDVQDPTQFDPAFVHVLAYNIASELGFPLTQNTARVQMALQQMAGKNDIARFAGAQENAPREWDVDVLLRSRN